MIIGSIFYFLWMAAEPGFRFNLYRRKSGKGFPLYPCRKLLLVDANAFLGNI
jgi:hypothetical protein